MKCKLKTTEQRIILLVVANLLFSMPKILIFKISSNCSINYVENETVYRRVFFLGNFQ